VFFCPVQPDISAIKKMHDIYSARFVCGKSNGKQTVGLL
jgi:hypothetical protein